MEIYYSRNIKIFNNKRPAALRPAGARRSAAALSAGQLNVRVVVVEQPALAKSVIEPLFPGVGQVANGPVDPGGHGVVVHIDVHPEVSIAIAIQEAVDPAGSILTAHVKILEDNGVLALIDRQDKADRAGIVVLHGDLGTICVVEVDTQTDVHLLKVGFVDTVVLRHFDRIRTAADQNGQHDENQEGLHGLSSLAL